MPNRRQDTRPIQAHHIIFFDFEITMQMLQSAFGTCHFIQKKSPMYVAEWFIIELSFSSLNNVTLIRLYVY